METKFSFYDFISNIIPGAVVLWSFSFLLRSLPISIPIQISGGVAETTIFLILAYFVGNLVQTLSKRYENRLRTAWDGFPSVRFLREEDSFYSEDFKTALRKAITTFFKLPDSPASFEDASAEGIKKAKDKHNQELFNLCYTFVENNKASDKPYILNSLYGFFRGLITASSICILIFGVLTLWRFVEIIWYGGNVWSLIVAVVLLAFFVFARKLSKERTKQRSENFADSVYRSFFVCYQSRTDVEGKRCSEGETS